MELILVLLDSLKPMEYWWIVVALIYSLTIVGIIMVIILDNRNPSRTLAWILALIIFPILGVIAYSFLGQNYRRKKLFSRKGLQDKIRLDIISAMQLAEMAEIDELLTDQDVLDKKDTIHLLLNNSNSALLPNQNVKILNNGIETFEAIFAAIENAKEYIHIEYYILKFDDIGTRLMELLKKKAAEGIIIRVIYDSVGSLGLKKKKLKEYRDAGINIKSFLKIYFPIFSSRDNYRNHRKIVVVDGRVGFTGGINVSDRYIKGLPRFGSWRDTFVRIEGNSAYALDAVFCGDWYFMTKENIESSTKVYLYDQGSANLTQIIQGCPDFEWKVIHQFYLSAINSAKKSVYLTTPYFIPSDEIVTAIKIAGLRGLDVKLILPEKNDSILTKACSETYLGELIRAGVKVYKYQPGFVHSKIIIIDGVVSSVGTANIDYRSLETNFEVNAVFYDKKIAADLAKSFNEDILKSNLLTLEEWENRPILTKLFQSLTRLLAPAM